MSGERVVELDNGDRVANVVMWNMRSGKTIHSQVVSKSGFNGVATTRDDRLVIFVSDDGLVHVYDRASSFRPYSLRGHDGAALGVAVSDDGGVAVSASADWTLKVWEIAKHAGARNVLEYDDAHGTTTHLSSVNGVAVTADGRFAISAPSEPNLKVWNTTTNQATYLLRGVSESVGCVAVATDGKTVVAASPDSKIMLWNLAALRSARETVIPLRGSYHGQSQLSPVSTLECEQGGITGVAVVRRGNVLVAHGAGIDVLNAQTGAVVKRLSVGMGGVRCVAISRDGRFVVAAFYDRVVRVLDAESRAVICVWGPCASAVTALAVSSNGCLVAAASADGVIRIWQLPDGRELCAVQAHEQQIHGVTFLSGGSVSGGDIFIVSVAADRTLKVWSLVAARVVLALGTRMSLTCCATMPEGRTIVAGDLAGGVHFVDWIRGDLLCQ
jgi:WD40 repeat protein